MGTYRLEIGETGSGEELTVDLYNEGGTIEEAVHVPYEDHGLGAARDEGRPSQRDREFREDVMTTDLQIERRQGAFVVRALGDGEEIHSERIDEDDGS
ncbi:hypothetical protein BRC94_02430 [Halobacteriales archaeon QS_5_70_17]|nr:MAG: hypothetical protein BRC94_02430 [Halobacteriales archaeon QS_5_70_17]